MDEMKQYCDTVCEQIRWKKARIAVAAEMEDHLRDQKDAYLSAGMEENTAAQEAVRQMGDPVAVGLELDKTHKPKPQWGMLVLTGMLMLAGVFVSGYIASFPDSLSRFQGVSYIVAFGVLLACYFADFTLLGKFALPLYFALVFLPAAMVPFALTVQGRLYWMVGRFSVGLANLFLVFSLAYALLVYAMRRKGKRGILLCGLGYLPPAAILIYVPTLAGLFLFTVTGLVILCLSIGRGWFGVEKKKGLAMVLVPTFLIGAAAAAWLQFTGTLQRKLGVFFNPTAYQETEGYPAAFVREILTGCRWLGEGITTSYGADSLMDAHFFRVDYTLTSLIHRYGWIVLLGVVLLFAAFILAGVLKIEKQKSVLGFLVAISVLLPFFLQAVFYIMENLGYTVSNSLASLPLISYGNSQLFLHAALIGFMLSVFRTGGVFRDTIRSVSKERPFVSYEDGKLIINLRA